MQAAFDYAVEYVHDRKQFGVPVGTFQLMQGHSHVGLAEGVCLIISPLKRKSPTCTQNLVRADRMSMPWPELVTRARSVAGYVAPHRLNQTH